MENNNGRGIFYGVIGVATLIVAIIGATFAFFSAQTNSANNAITAASSEANTLSIIDEVKTGLKTNLIPVAETNTKFKTVVGTSADDCKDDNNNNICSTYTFTIKNSGSQNQQIYFYLVPTSNTFGNLSVAVFKGKGADITTYDVTGTVGTETTTGTVANGTLLYSSTANGASYTPLSTTVVNLDKISQVIPAGQERTYTIVLWVHDTGADQTTADANKSFAGGITVKTSSQYDGTATEGITGVLAA